MSSKKQRSSDGTFQPSDSDTPPEDSGDTPPATLTPPDGPSIESAQIDPTAPAKPEQAQQVVRVRPVLNMSEEVTVVPRQTVAKMRIGQDWYAFRQGKQCKVPRRIVDHLKRKNII